MTTFATISLSILGLATMLFIAGCSSNQSQRVSLAATADSEGYVCPLTGETLPCPKCCPLNK